MIKISDYLNYLSNEVIQARKAADLHSIQIAKEYAEHEYLRYFRVPRFSLPTIKMDIPLKISELDAKTDYQFKMDRSAFIHEINIEVADINKRRNTHILPVTEKIFFNDYLNDSILFLEKQNENNIQKPDEILKEVNFKELLEALLKDGFLKVREGNQERADEELIQGLNSALKNRYVPISAVLRDAFIDPHTSKETDGKVLVNLHLEMIEEGFRIVKMEDEDGQEFEQIIFE